MLTLPTFRQRHIKLTGKSSHFQRLALADLYLDTFTVNAATTAIDALWSGLPVLTKRGSSFFSRISSSLLIDSGFEQMMCDTQEEYMKRAIMYANDKNALELVRQQLITGRKSMALFDIQSFCKHLEAAYEKMLADAGSQ